MAIVPTEPSGAALERPDSSAGLQPSTKLQQFARDAQAVYAIALSLAPTPFVPTSYKKRGQQWLEAQQVAQTVAAAILAGDEIGLSPMQSLQGIDVIEGRPALSALAQRALVQSHGHEVWVHERVADTRQTRTTVSVTVRGRRAGSDHVAESTWSLDRARQAGLLSKSNWQNHPEAMCFARASADVCRQIAADVLMGLAYSSEELEDEEAFAAAGAGSHSVAVRPKEEPAEEKADTAAAPEEGEAPIPGQTSEPDTAEREQDDEPICGRPKEGEPTKICSRPFEHTGRHFYGKEISAEEATARAAEEESEPTPLANPETTEPKLDPGIEDPERCSAENPKTGRRCTLKQGHEGPHVEEGAAPAEDPGCPYHRGGHKCVREARHEGLHRANTPAGLMEWGEGAAAPEPSPEEAVQDEAEEELFTQPTDEELEAALEAERAERAEQEAAAVPAEPAQPAPTADSTDSEALPVEDPDDPWADFQ